jgi:uncharacterized membrane protein YbaN (DUF454 family)
VEQCLGKVLGIIGQVLSVFKSNMFHVDIFWFYLLDWGIFYNFLWNDRYFSWSLELQPIRLQQLHEKWYLVSYGILYVTRVAFPMTLLMHKWTKYYHGWWMGSSIGKNPTFSCQQLATKYYHGWLKFGWKHHLISDRP